MCELPGEEIEMGLGALELMLVNVTKLLSLSRTELRLDKQYAFPTTGCSLQ